MRQVLLVRFGEIFLKGLNRPYFMRALVARVKEAAAPFGGSVWLQGHAPDLSTLLAGLVCGLPAAAVLVVNNTRDRVADLRVGRRTLAALLSRAGATRAYAFMMLLPFALLPLLAWFGHVGALLGLFALPNALAKVRAFAAASSDPALNPLLPATARCGLILAVLLTTGFLLELA